MNSKKRKAEIESGLTSALTAGNVYFDDENDTATGATQAAASGAQQEPAHTDQQTQLYTQTQIDAMQQNNLLKIVQLRALPNAREAKTKRLQVVLRPSVYNMAKAAATQRGYSLNDFLDRLLEKYAEGAEV